MYYVYLLECQEDKSWYIGYSEDLKKRIMDHKSGNGCRTTSRKKDWKLIYYESYLNKADALGREKFLKGGSGRAYLKKQLKHYLTEGPCSEKVIGMKEKKKDENSAMEE